MVQLKIKKNFDFDQLVRNVKSTTSVFLNDLAKPIKKDWDKRVTRPISPSLKKSTTDLHGQHSSLNLTGKLASSNKILPASKSKLKAIVKNTAKSTRHYKIRTPNGKIYKGTRKSDPVFYGYWVNKGFDTSTKSLVPNTTVPGRDFTSFSLKDLESMSEYKTASNKFIRSLKKSMKVRF